MFIIKVVKSRGVGQNTCLFFRDITIYWPENHIHCIPCWTQGRQWIYSSKQEHGFRFDVAWCLWLDLNLFVLDTVYIDAFFYFFSCFLLFSFFFYFSSSFYFLYFFFFFFSSWLRAFNKLLEYLGQGNSGSKLIWP